MSYALPEFLALAAITIDQGVEHHGVMLVDTREKLMGKDNRYFPAGRYLIANIYSNGNS